MNYDEQQKHRAKIRQHPIDFLKEKGFQRELELVKQGRCPVCAKKVHTSMFEGRDIKYAKEFALTGICPFCMDRMSNIATGKR